MDKKALKAYKKSQESTKEVAKAIAEESLKLFSFNFSAHAKKSRLINELTNIFSNDLCNHNSNYDIKKLSTDPVSFGKLVGITQKALQEPIIIGPGNKKYAFIDHKRHSKADSIFNPKNQQDYTQCLTLIKNQIFSDIDKEVKNRSFAAFSTITLTEEALRRHTGEYSRRGSIHSSIGSEDSRMWGSGYVPIPTRSSNHSHRSTVRPRIALDEESLDGRSTINLSLRSSRHGSERGLLSRSSSFRSTDSGSSRSSF